MEDVKCGASDEILSCLLQFNIFLCLIFFPLFSSQLALVCLCPFIPLRFSMFWRKECRVVRLCVCLPERVCMCVCLSVRVCWSRFELLRAISRDKSQSRMAVVGHPVPIQPSRPWPTVNGLLACGGDTKEGKNRTFQVGCLLPEEVQVRGVRTHRTLFEVYFSISLLSYLTS